jgi:VCBS repeat-containing protein
LVAGALVANTDDQTGAVTTTTTAAPEYYLSLEAMTADLRAAYEGLAAANPIFAGVAPVGAAFLAAVQDGTATCDPYAPDAGTDGKVDLWWDDNLHASKYGSYLSGLTLFGTLTGLDPRSLGAAEHVAADLGITQAEAAALQGVAAATLGFSLDAHWTAPGQVTELPGGVTGLLATAGSFGFSDSDVADTHTIAVTPLTPGAVGTFTTALHTDTTGDGTGGTINWLFTVDNAAVEFLAPDETRVEHFLVTISNANGGLAQREIAVTINGSYNDAPVTSNDFAYSQVDGISVNAPGVLGNDTDPEGNALVVSAVNGLGVNVGVPTAGTYGHLAPFSDGHYGYAADNSAAVALAPTGSHLQDIFSYTVGDGHGGTASAVLDITLNRGPVAAADTATATTGIGGTASGNVLANESDADGDNLAAAPGTVLGSHGTLVLGTDGGYTYTVTDLTGAAGSHLHDIFSYTVSDGHGGTASAALDITLNRGPVANADVAGVSRGGLVSGNVLANDFDTDGDAIALAALNGGALGQQLHGNYGWLTLYSDGRYSYQSDGNTRLPAHGVSQDKFTYAVTDAHGGTSTASLTVTTSAHGQAYFSGTPGQTISAGSGQAIVDGTLGDQTLSGGNGSDVLLGGPNDVLAGGSGADQFVFQYDFGHNEIKDFGQPDVIELQASTFGSIASIFAHYAVDDGHGNVLISDPHSAANTITVDHVSLSQLSANSFLLT